MNHTVTHLFDPLSIEFSDKGVYSDLVMASETEQQVDDIVSAEGVSDQTANTTGRDAATVEGLIVAYSLMFSMALLPIFVGSIRSVQYHYNLKVYL